MAILLDTSFSAAFFNTRDSNHQKTIALKKSFDHGEYGKQYITDLPFNEIETLLRIRASRGSLAAEAGDAILGDPRISLLKTDEDLFEHTWQIFKKFTFFSFADACSIAHGKTNCIKNIGSFDEDFEKLHDTKRVY